MIIEQPMPAEYEFGSDALDRGAVRQALILLLIGGPIVIVDFTIAQGGGPPFDILNDTIGMLLITWAAFLLGRLPEGEAYGRLMLFVQGASILLTIWSVLVQIEPPLAASLLGILFGGVAAAAAMALCVAMRTLARRHGLQRSTDWWRRSHLLVTFVWGGGWLLGALFSLGTRASGPVAYFSGVQGSVGPALVLFGLVVVAIVLIPGIFVIVAISKTLSELRSGPPGPGALA